MVDITITCNCCGNREHNSFNSIENAIEYLQTKFKHNMTSVYSECRTTTTKYDECRTTTTYDECRTTTYDECRTTTT